MNTAPATTRGGGVLIGALVIDSLGGGLFMPLSLIFFTKLTDVPLGLLGILISVANIIPLPIPIWAGTLADRFGALPLVIGAQALQAVGFLAYPWVHEPVGIFVAVALTAVGVRFFWSAIFTAIADYVDGSATPRNKDTWYAWANMARTAGLGVGGLVTGAAIADGHAGGYRAIAYAAAGCYAGAAVTITAFVRAPRIRHLEELPGSGYATLLRDRPFLALTGINTVFALSSMMLGLALPTFLVDGLKAPAWLTSVVLVGNAVLISLLGGPLVSRLRPFRRTRLIVLAAGLWTVWSLVLAVLPPGRLAWVAPLLVGATLLFTVAEVIHAPVSMSMAAAVAPAQIRGRYLAAFQYSFTIAGIIGPTFFTALFGVARGLPWVMLAVVNVLAAGAVLLLERTLAPELLRDPDPAVVPADPVPQ